MKVTATKSFIKQIRLLPKNYKLRIDGYVVLMNNAKNLHELPFIEEMKGYKNYYKIRVGYLRVGLHTTDNDTQIVLDCVLPRGDVYKYFP